MSWLWTWGGRCFGYRDGENLWTCDGKHVGKFWGEEIYGPDGRYLGQLWTDNRLISSTSKKAWRRSPFPQQNNRSSAGPTYPSRAAYYFRFGYEDFPGF